ncbi:triosephosphate isomerase [Candidatus Daviesbacteria bacterium]|nr:triosephosphate isomerase [Candidatus Daviesbacteria bacterium]
MDGGENNKTIWIIANWKSNKTISEALDWISKVGPKVPQSDALNVVVCPTFSCLSEVAKEIKVNNFNMAVGAQDLSAYGVGAYTGEEAAELLGQMVNLAILGHSERRENFFESDEVVSKKTSEALNNQIIPLVCVQNLETLVPEGCKLVAYEPVFAIGSGNPDTPENANNVAGALKEKVGPDLEVLYGGSVNADNAKSFIEKVNISGFLIGKASLDPQEFIKIIEVCER